MLGQCFAAQAGKFVATVEADFFTGKAGADGDSGLGIGHVEATFLVQG
jgi:hypothetical protein